MVVVEVVAARRRGERLNLVGRYTTEYAEDGKTVWRETTEFFDGTVNETPTYKRVEEHVVAPPPPWRKFIRFYRRDPISGTWKLDKTIELDKDGAIVAIK